MGLRRWVLSAMVRKRLSVSSHHRRSDVPFAFGFGAPTAGAIGYEQIFQNSDGDPRLVEDHVQQFLSLLVRAHARRELVH